GRSRTQACEVHGCEILHVRTGIPGMGPVWLRPWFPAYPKFRIKSALNRCQSRVAATQNAGEVAEAVQDGIHDEVPGASPGDEAAVEALLEKAVAGPGMVGTGILGCDAPQVVGLGAHLPRGPHHLPLRRVRGEALGLALRLADGPRIQVDGPIALEDQQATRLEDITVARMDDASASCWREAAPDGAI